MHGHLSVKMNVKFDTDTTYKRTNHKTYDIYFHALKKK